MELVASEDMTLQHDVVVLIVREQILLISEIMRHVIFVLHFVGPAAQSLDYCLPEPHPVDADRASQVFYLLILLEQLLVVLLGHLYPVMVVCAWFCFFLGDAVARGRDQFLVEAQMVHLNNLLLSLHCGVCGTGGGAFPLGGVEVLLHDHDRHWAYIRRHLLSTRALARNDQIRIPYL